VEFVSGEQVPTEERGMCAPVAETRGVRVRGRRGIPIVDTLGSIWFGVVVMVLIFVYSAIGSAVPPVRQGALADWLGIEALRFEMTEMEWFHTPVFVGLVVLLCVSMVVSTVRRVPLTLPRLGGWLTHAGIIVLTIGCAVYFGRKLEGDTVLYGRTALISAGPGAPPVKLIVRPGATAMVGAGADAYRVTVQQLIPRYEIRSGDDASKQTTAIWFDVQRAGAAAGRRFTRVVLVGYPQYTEDVLVGDDGRMQRAVNAVGTRLADPSLRIALAYEPQDAFYLVHTAAVYARFEEGADWIEAPVRRLPRYYEHVSSSKDVWPSADGTLPALRPIDIPLRAEGAGADGKAFDALDVRVVGYLPYAVLDERWTPGGEALNPVIRFSLSQGTGRTAYQLAAFDPDRNRIAFDDIGFHIVFRWAQTEAQREALARRHKPRLVFEVEGAAEAVTIPLADLLDAGPRPVGQTGYTVSLARADVIPHFMMPDEQGRGVPTSVASVTVTKGESTVRRMVFAGMPSHNMDVDDTGAPTGRRADTALRIRFEDPSPVGVLILGGPTEQDCELILNRVDGRQVRAAAPIGEPVSLFTGAMPLTVEALTARAVEATRPMIVPRGQRQPMQNVGPSYSLLAVEVREGNRAQWVWLPYNAYPFPDARYAYPARFANGSYSPRSIRLSDGRTLELLYSRERRYLPATMALERFVLETDPGAQRERDFISHVRFYEDGDWSDVHTVRSNRPGAYGPFWFFQAQWDPGAEALTVLGVGNREGIGTMLAGVCLSVIGMLYSFYVRPWLSRRPTMNGGGAAGGVRIDG
jgi:hypothetical protein